MSKATQTTPPRSNSGRPQSEIARLAEEIEKLWRLSNEIDVKGAGNCEEEVRMLPDGRGASVFFKGIEKEAYYRIRVLERAVSLLEPETLDDVLTLAVLLNNEIDCFIDEYTDEVTNQEALADEFRFNEAKRRVERLRHAVIRGLLKFASSPIAEEHYVSSVWDASPWANDMETAAAELAKMPAKLGKEANRTNSATQH